LPSGRKKRAMTDDKELIADLRAFADDDYADLSISAADRIEALIAERDAAVGALRVIAGNNCITCSAEAFNVLFAMKHPAKIKEGKL
jgi:hypothetical protein